ncbi:MAG: hypothetical protein K8I29_16130 [Alphaproteobacteria bacterium]|uniref:Lipoprotein n=1 Tax=Candidatus Nitrobium versatile TaxID=2884831 RepID=A0A953SH69_9BACT|nr:hypothetical protein [Candidatus Nitrobium versatile]
MRNYLLALLCTILVSCGGGGGGSSSLLSSTNADKAGSALAQTIGIESSLSELGEYGTSKSLPSSPGSPLTAILSNAVSIAGSSQGDGLNKMSSSSCSGGGSIAVSDSGSAYNASFNSCRSGTVTMSGSMNIALDGSRYTVTTSGFSYSETSTDTSLNLDNLTIVYSSVTMSGSRLTGYTGTITGSITGTMRGKAVSEECNNLSISTSLTNGVTVSISGQVKYGCLGSDWLTVTTTTPIYYPASSYSGVSGGSFSGSVEGVSIYSWSPRSTSVSACPTAGEVTATSGGNTVKVSIASDSKVSLYYNDSLIQTYSDCDSIEGLCT